MSDLSQNPGSSFLLMMVIGSQLEAKQLAGSFGVMPSDAAYDAARLEFKLVDQPIMTTHGSDLTKPFNEVSSKSTP